MIEAGSGLLLLLLDGRRYSPFVGELASALDNAKYLAMICLFENPQSLRWIDIILR
jgi:hypothetical protein